MLSISKRNYRRADESFDASRVLASTHAQPNWMDPQVQRIFLEIAWETLESTGYLPQKNTRALAGVFAGVGYNNVIHKQRAWRTL